MALKYLDQKKLLGFKLEGTAYTGETLVSADYYLRAENIKYSPNIEMLERKHSTGTFAKETGIIGKQSATLGFRVYLSRGVSATTVPDWAKPLQACGYKLTSMAGGVKLESHSQYGRTPATIEMQVLQEGVTPKAMIFKLIGCMGDADFVLDTVGSPVAIDFNFQGVLTSVTSVASGSAKVFTPSTDTLPPAVLSSTMNAHGVVMDFDKVTIKTGNQIVVALDPTKATGYEGAHIVDKASTVSIDPYLNDLTSYDWYTQQLANTEAQLDWTIGATIPVKITIPKTQIVKSMELGERNRLSVNPLDFTVHGASGTSYESDIKIVQGVES